MFNNCRITGAGNAITDLGRPWGLASVIKGNRSTIGVGALSPGIYTMRLFNGQVIVSKKFLKK